MSRLSIEPTAKNLKKDFDSASGESGAAEEKKRLFDSAVNCHVYFLDSNI